jgi:peroxiredoxin Q/BCP
VCSLRDAAKPFAELGVRVFGISLDGVADQAAFHKAQELQFPLLSDPDGSVAAKYGALMEGRPYARRVSFVIDDAGVLRHVDDKVDVMQHGAQLVEVIRKLRG